MAKNNLKGNLPEQKAAKNERAANEEYDELELLERLESLQEDMDDLGVTTLAEVVERINALHKQLDSK